MSRLKKLWEAGDIETYRRIFVIAALRRASYRWPARTEAMRESRIARGLYKCAECGTQHKLREGHLDHVEPVVEPSRGFTDFNDYVLRLLPGRRGWQRLCVGCHVEKTKGENAVRRRSRKAAAGGSR